MPRPQTPHLADVQRRYGEVQNRLRFLPAQLLMNGMHVSNSVVIWIMTEHSSRRCTIRRDGKTIKPRSMSLPHRSNSSQQGKPGQSRNGVPTKRFDLRQRLFAAYLSRVCVSALAYSASRESRAVGPNVTTLAGTPTALGLTFSRM